LIFPLLGTGLAAADAPPPAAFQRVCYECHGDGANKGEFALDQLLAAERNPQTKGHWLKVWKNVRDEFMPTADSSEEATAADRREVARWIEQEIFGVDPQRIDPGAVTIRRLNREEYQNSVNDLLGTDFELRDRMLPDDTAHGFDNIGDAQTLSPVQFVRYLDLAEWITGQVAVDSGIPLPSVTLDAVGPMPPNRVSRKALKAKDGVVAVELPVRFERDGQYRLAVDVELGGWQDYAGDARIVASIGGQVIGEKTLPFAGEVEKKLQWEFSGKAGQQTVSFRAQLVNQPAPAAAKEAKKPDAPARPRNPEFEAMRAEAKRLFEEEFGPQEKGEAPKPPVLAFRQLELTVTGPLDGSVRGEYPATHRRIFFQGPAPKDAAGRKKYATAILRRLADRAFHRPVDERSLSGLVDLALEDKNFERGVGSALTAILSSSRFLFRGEPLPAASTTASEPLDEHALASRLSYLLWVSIPDDELLRLAGAGELRRNFAAQIQRMLADPKSQRMFRDFSGQWLRTRNILLTAITPGSVADRLEPVREAMKAETDLFFEDVARHDHDLAELLTANYTFLNEPLAKYYGIPGVSGEEMRRVELPADSHRGGLLTHGSILVSTSNPNRTSPVKRGVFVLENILGTPPPPPPAAVPDLEEAKKKAAGDVKTLRAQLALHRADRACAACHAHFDPIGLALENFSYVGRWRERERGEPIDAKGTMVTGESFDDFVGMRAALLARKDKFYRCVTEKLLTYALGRGLEPSDAATVDALTDRLLKEGGKFSTLLMGVVESPAFQRRRSEANPAITASR
jgi:hypothetical protein